MQVFIALVFFTGVTLLIRHLGDCFEQFSQIDKTLSDLLYLMSHASPFLLSRDYVAFAPILRVICDGCEIFIDLVQDADVRGWKL